MTEHGCYRDNLADLNAEALRVDSPGNIQTSSNPGTTQDYIRLLRPLRQTTDAPWELKIVSLSSSPPYAALSYSWGSERALSTNLQIRFHTNYGPHETLEARLPITSSLNEALTGLKQINSYEWLWVDAVCINQSSTREKNDQVSRMRHIYAAAQCTFVWLGQSVPEPDTEAEAVILGGGALTPSKMLDLHHQARYAWFRRLWIVQELLCSHEVLFCIGTHTISCDAFRAGFQTVQVDVPRYVSVEKDQSPFYLRPLMSVGLLPKHNPHSHQDSVRNSLQSMKARMEELFRLRDAFVPRSKVGLDMEDLLKATSQTSASLRNDRVYSLLGLAAPEYQDKVPISYDTEWQYVFALVTVAIIDKTSKLNILTESWIHMGSPAWVPAYGGWKSGSWQDETFRKEYKASGDTTAHIHYAYPELTIKGLYFDTVYDVADHYSLFRGKILPVSTYVAGSARHKAGISSPQKDPRFALQPRCFSREKPRRATDVPYPVFEDINFMTNMGFEGRGSTLRGGVIIVPFGASVPWMLERVGDATVTRGRGNVYKLKGNCHVPAIVKGELLALYETKQVNAEEFILV